MLVRSTVIFLALTFGIAWGLPALYVALVPDVRDALIGLGIVHFLSTFGPAIGGIAAAASCGRETMQRHFAFLTRFAVGWRWYAATVAMIAAMYVAAEILKRANGGSPLYGLWSLWALLLFVPLIGDQGALEELGFRGWLLPSMQRAFSPNLAALIVGVIWFLFHYTILLPGFPIMSPRLPRWDYVAAFFVQILALSFILTVLFNASGGSVPLVFVAHWLINVAIKVPAYSGHWAIWPGTMLLVAVVVVLLGRRSLTDPGKLTTP